MDREALERPFPPDQIKHRKGNFNRTLAYLESHTVIQRLNDALDATWSFEVLSHEVLRDEILVLGKLTAGHITKTQFGSSAITRSKSSGEVISLGDDLKSAATDALKKAATLLGVGNYLYAGESQPQVPGPGHANDHQERSSSPVPLNGNNSAHSRAPQQVTSPDPSQAPHHAPSPDPSPAGLSHNHQQNNHGGHTKNGYQRENQKTRNENKRISSKQLNYIHSIAKEKGITQKELNDSSVDRFGVVVDFLSRRDASTLIEDLLNAPGTNPRSNREAAHA